MKQDVLWMAFVALALAGSLLLGFLAGWFARARTERALRREVREELALSEGRRLQKEPESTQTPPAPDSAKTSVYDVRKILRRELGG